MLALWPKVGVMWRGINMKGGPNSKVTRKELCIAFAIAFVLANAFCIASYLTMGSN